MKEPSEDKILRSVVKSGALMSHGIDVEMPNDGKPGVIFVGGFRHVGSFTIHDSTHERAVSA